MPTQVTSFLSGAGVNTARIDKLKLLEAEHRTYIFHIANSYYFILQTISPHCKDHQLTQLRLSKKQDLFSALYNNIYTC